MASGTAWDRFAQQDAEYYILTDPGVDYSSAEGQRHFYESGEKLVARSLKVAEPHLSSHQRALEIGPGIGRLTLPHARIFDEISAVDVSPTMLSHLEVNIRKHGYDNVQTYLPDTAWDVPEYYDYAYSFIVFQHISDWNVIVDYVARIARSLKTGGLAQLQFDTRHRTLGYELRNRMPDLLLPKTQRRGIRRIRRTPDELRKLFSQHGLRVLQEIAVGTEHGTFLLQRIRKQHAM